MRRKRFSFSSSLAFWALFFVAILISGAYAFLTPKRYEATATLLKPFPKEESEILKIITSNDEEIVSLSQDQNSLSKLIAPKLGWGGWRLTNILQSRYIAEQAADKLYLDLSAPKSKIENRKSKAKIVEKLRKSVIMESDPLVMTLKIKGRAKTPELAAKIVNCYVQLLDEYVAKNNLTSADRLQDFMLEEIDRARINLQSAENALREFEEANKISYLDELRTSTAVAWRMRREALKLQLKLDMLKKMGASQENVERKETEFQLEAVYRQIKKIRYGDKLNLNKLSTYMYIPIIPIKLAPQLEMNLSKLIREVKIQQDIYLSLLKEYEYARVFFQEEGASFHIIDKAIPINKPTSFQKWLIISIGSIIGAILATIIPISRMIISQLQ